MVARQSLDLLVGVQILPGEIVKPLCFKVFTGKLPKNGVCISLNNRPTQKVAEKLSMSVYLRFDMNTYPFSVYKRTDRPYFLVSFKNADGKFLPGISTKKKTEDEAMAVAFQWLRDGVPQKKETFNTHELILKDTAKKIKTSNEAEALLSELKRLGWIKNGVVKETPAAENLISFLKNFWEWDTSPYIN